MIDPDEFIRQMALLREKLDRQIMKDLIAGMGFQPSEPSSSTLSADKLYAALAPRAPSPYVPQYGQADWINDRIGFTGSLGHLVGLQIIISKHAVKTKFCVRGIPAGRKPNRYRPYYRRVRVNTPLMYLLKPNTVICHPSLDEKIRKKFTG